MTVKIMAAIRSRVYLLILCLCILILFFFWTPMLGVKRQDKSSEVHPLSAQLERSASQDLFASCLEKKIERRIDKLLDNVHVLQNSPIKYCKELYDKFKSMYEVELSVSPLKLGHEFAKKMKQWLGNSTLLTKLAESQRIIVVHDKLRKLTTVYNSLRSKRPSSYTRGSQKLFLKDLMQSSKANCDFCSPLNMTAEDIFGRIVGKYSVSASNAFKLSKWHGLFIPYEHDIFEIDEIRFFDLFNTSLKWFKKVVSIESSAQYPALFWDIFPHAGASQMHVHVHGLAGVDHYVGEFKDLLNMIGMYHKMSGYHYWNTLVDIHISLGLSLRYGKSTVISPLAPRREHELWILSEEPNKEFFQLLYFIIKMYQEDLGKYCFSMAGALPVTGQKISDFLLSLPVILMIGTRGDCTSLTNDVSSLELYLFNNVNTDPYQTMSSLLHFVSSSSLTPSTKDDVVDLWN